jgi:pyruvate/2-oxoglutarate dehydrogenase complex dihydrolipoamide acyltransferase (E2) component
MRYAVHSALVALMLAAPAAAAQQPAEAQASATPSAPPATAQTRTSGDSLSIEITPELQRTLDELAASLDRVGRRIANDPELRASAVRAAQSFVGVAQVIVVQQADILQEALKAMSDRLATLPAPPPQPLQH